MLNYLHQNEDFQPGKDWVLYSSPYFCGKEVLAAINSLINSKWSVGGPSVLRFEQEFSKKFNEPESAAINSGSSANLAMIAALKRHYGWQDGDGILVSAVNFPTTISVIVQNNLIPHFIDISWNDLNLDLALLENWADKIKSLNIKALFLSPVLGNSPNIDRLLGFCNKYKLKLVMDNCDSLGSKYSNVYLNEYSVASSCSFYVSHHLTTFSGGMVSSSPEIIKLVKSIVQWGRDCYCSSTNNLLPNGTCGRRFDKWLENCDDIVDHRYIFTGLGYNLQMLDLQGAIGLVQLSKFDEIHRLRRYHRDKIYEMAAKHLFKYNIRTLNELGGCITSWFGFAIICEDKETKHKLQQYLESNKIQTRNYFAGSLLMQPGYKHLGDYKQYPVAAKVLSNVFFIGVNPNYNDNVLKYIEKVFSEFRP